MAEDRIPLAQSLNSRTASLSKDAYAANCYFETTRDGRKLTIKRPGHARVTITGDTIVPGQAQGLVYWDGRLIVVVGNTVYSITPAGICTICGTIVPTVSSGSGAVNSIVVNGLTVNSGNTTSSVDSVWFTRTAGDAYLFFHSKYVAYYMVAGSNTITTVNTNITTFATGSAYLDGYVFALGTNGRLYNSAIENPSSWNALDFISAESDPDNAVALIRQLNYLVVFGQWSTEFFYDNRNPNASPLNVQSSLKLEVGCANGDSVAKIDQSVLWVGKSKLHGRGVYLLDNGTSPSCVSTPAVERFLNANHSGDMFSLTFRIEGHTFYVLSLEAAGITLVYDLNEKEWYIWTSFNGVEEESFDLGFYTEFNDLYYALGRTTGGIYTMSVNTYNDEDYPIHYRVVTNLTDSGTSRRKFYEHVEVIGDKVNGNVVISNTSNDYVSWTEGRTTSLNNIRTQLYSLGMARRRAWQILITDPIPVRLESFEVRYEIGNLEEGGG